MSDALIIFICYLLGAIPFSYIITKLTSGSDIREKGSGNVGATNVLRVMGWKVALLALVGDLLKGLAAAALGYFGSRYIGSQLEPAFMSAFGGLAAAIGHCWPVFLGFRGGKGVATTAGALFFLMPWQTTALLLAFAGIIAVSRYVSLGSVSVAILLPPLVYITSDIKSYFSISLILAIIVVFKHRENIAKLMNGTERKIGEKAQ